MIYACHAIILVKVLKINQQNKGACNSELEEENILQWRINIWLTKDTDK